MGIVQPSNKSLLQQTVDSLFLEQYSKLTLPGFLSGSLSEAVMASEAVGRAEPVMAMARIVKSLVSCILAELVSG